MLIDTDVELSYWEGLRAYWRIDWPAQVAAIVFAIVYAMVHSGRTEVLGRSCRTGSSVYVTTDPIETSVKTLCECRPRGLAAR